MEEKEIKTINAHEKVQPEPMTDKEQKILNTRLRLALRTGELPFTFTDDQEKDYRKIVYSVGVEMGNKFTANKVGNFWTISEAADQVDVFVCDVCGKEKSGKRFPVLDENFSKQNGLNQCEDCFALSAK